MGTHLQEMMQEDEGATIRIEELERKLRLAESLADHIYTKYEEGHILFHIGTFHPNYFFC